MSEKTYEYPESAINKMNEKTMADCKEIEGLKAQNQALLEALEEIVRFENDKDNLGLMRYCLNKSIEIAKEAIQGEEG